MGSRRAETRETETEDEKNSSREFSADESSTTTLNGAGVPITETRDIDRAESHYGIEIPDRRTLQQLQIAEDVHGSRVHEWVAEGIPTDILGKTRDMAAFRDRQAKRPPEVPTDIERRNNRSVQRSEQAAQETGPAGETSVPESVRDVIASSGQSLDADIQRVMEDRMGDSFGDVQIHTGPRAAAACEDINARAFTVGNNIAFTRGEYDPASADGQHVLAHELTHVRQQTGGAVSMLPQENVEFEIDPNPELEREAEETAQRVMAGGGLGIQRLAETDVHVQRMGVGGPDRDETMNLSGPESTTDTGNAGDGGGLSDSRPEDFEALADRVMKLQQMVESDGPGIAELGTQEAIKAFAGQAISAAGATAVAGAFMGPVVASIGGAAVLGIAMQQADQDITGWVKDKVSGLLDRETNEEASRETGGQTEAEDSRSLDLL